MLCWDVTSYEPYAVNFYLCLYAIGKNCESSPQCEQTLRT